jgi:cobyrinic acid a,c-diamide synthase
MALMPEEDWNRVLDITLSGFYNVTQPLLPAMQLHKFGRIVNMASVSGLKGHEFHYYDSSMNGESCTAKKPFRETQWSCMINRNNGIWGFPHFYYASKPAFVDSFIDRMKEVRDGKLK